MIKAVDGKVTFRGERGNVMAEAVTVLRALKEVVQRKSTKW